MTIIHTDLVTTGTAHNLGITNQTEVYVSRGTLLATTSGTAIAGTGTYQKAIIAGEVVNSGGYNAINLGGVGAVVNISYTGSVVASDANLTTAAISVYTSSLVTNAGYISGDTGISTDGGKIINTGEIIASPSNASVFSEGIVTWGDLELFNSGVISGTSNAIRKVNTQTASVTIDNSGTMVGDIDLYGGSETQEIKNTGDIFGEIITGDGADYVTNLGTIDDNVDLGGGMDTVINGGVINGDVFLHDGDDFYSAIGDGVVIGIVRGGDGHDAIKGGTLDDKLFGDDGNDIISGRAGDDYILGGFDEDKLYGNAGDDALYGQADVDTIYGGDGDDTLWGGTEDDYMRGGNDQDTLHGEDGNDDLGGGQGNDVLAGEEGNDALKGGQGDDDLAGNKGADSLFGNAGNDALNGGQGSDTLSGGRGDDTLEGGTGADVFVFERHSDNDIVVDFENNVDELDFSVFNTGSVSNLKVAAQDVSGGVLFDLSELGGIGTVLIEGVTKSQLNDVDLIF